MEIQQIALMCQILGFSLNTDLLQPNEGVLTQITFVDNDDTICVATETNYPPYITPVIADVDANYIPVTVGDCYENEDEPVLGCTDDDACNYNADATVDDESCEYAEENYDCVGNCIAEIDCDGVCGGISTPKYECFDGSIVCSLSDCSGGEPVTYNVYRDGEILTGGLMVANYVDSGLGYSEFHCYTVTYNYGGDFESEHSNEACAETNPEPVIPGCTNENACNYNAEATVDDGSCILL